MRKSIILITGVIIASMVFVGCGKGDNSSSKGGSTNIIQPTVSSEDVNDKYFVWTTPEQIFGLSDEGKKQKDIVIPAKCKEILTSFYENENIETVTFEGDDIILPKRMFGSCTNLKQVVFPKNLKELPESCFFMCNSLEEIVIPDSIEIIGEEVFEQCDGLKKVKLGSNVKTIGDKAFYGCDVLETVEFNDGLQTVGKQAFYTCNKIKEFRFGEGLISLGEEALFNCESLEAIYLPNSVTEIGDMAMNQLHQVTLYVKKGSFAEQYMNEGKGESAFLVKEYY